MHPFDKGARLNTLFALHPDSPSGSNTAYAAALIRQTRVIKSWKGLDSGAVQKAVNGLSDFALAAYGPDEALENAFRKIVADPGVVRVDGQLLARVLLPGLRDHELPTVADHLGVDLPTGKKTEVFTPATIAMVCFELLNVLADLNAETQESLIRVARGSGNPIEHVFIESFSLQFNSAKASDSSKKRRAR